MNERVVPPVARTLAAETFTAATPAARPPEGAEAMQRLADRLTSLVPPPAAVPLVAAELPQPSPAVTAALEKSAARAAEAARKAARRSRPLTARLVEAFVAVCRHAFPYALVGLALRLVIARVFFLDGQSRALGPQMSVELYGFDLSVVLPLQVKTQVLAGYSLLASVVSLSPAAVANIIGVAQFVLPVMLVLGFGTRFAALALFALTVLLDLYVMPQMLWAAHAYWVAILLVLVSLGPGAISVDQIFRSASRR